MRTLPNLLKVRRRRPPLWRRVLYVGGGILSLLAGVLGWLVPVVTGIPFLVLGVVLLSLGTPWIGRQVNGLERRLPERWRRKLRRAVAKIPGRRVKAAVNLPPALVRAP